MVRVCGCSWMTLIGIFEVVSALLPYLHNYVVV